MNKKLRTLCYSLMIIIGMCITQNVSAKVCYYGHTASGYNNSGYTNMSDYSKIQVSYDESSICYYVNGKTGNCFTDTGAGTDVINRIPISNWLNDSDGCIDNLYVASGAVSSSGTVKTMYAFLTNPDTISLGYHVEVTASPAIYISSNDKLTVKFKLPDGTTQTQQVEYGGTVVNDIEVDLVTTGDDGTGKVFDCWKIEGNSQCFNFSNSIKTDITLVAGTYEQEQTAGFLGISNKEVTCNGINIPYGLPYMISRLIKLIKIIVPIILIVLGIIDYSKAVISSDEKNMKESSSKFMRRVMAAVIIYFVVAIIQFGFGLLGESGNELFECFDCFTTGDCDIKTKSTK